MKKESVWRRRTGPLPLSFAHAIMGVNENTQYTRVCKATGNRLQFPLRSFSRGGSALHSHLISQF